MYLLCNPDFLSCRESLYRKSRVLTDIGCVIYLYTSDLCRARHPRTRPAPLSWILNSRYSKVQYIHALFSTDVLVYVVQYSVLHVKFMASLPSAVSYM